MAIRAAWAEIDLGALNHNYQEIKKQLKPGVKLCAVVKADAYGHGAVPVARAAVEAGAAYLAWRDTFSDAASSPPVTHIHGFEA